MKIAESSVKVWQCSRGPRRSRDSDMPGRELDDWDRLARWADEHAESTSKRDLSARWVDEFVEGPRTQADGGPGRSNIYF